MGILNFIKNIGPVEWIAIIVIIFLLFGGKILTMLGKRSGETFKEVKKVKDSFTDAVEGKEEPKNGEVQK